MAGYFALQNEAAEALENLRRAIDLGWRDVPALRADMLFEALVGLPAFAGLIEKLELQAPLP